MICLAILYGSNETFYMAGQSNSAQPGMLAISNRTEPTHKFARLMVRKAEPP
jgi:hypothetical protein